MAESRLAAAQGWGAGREEGPQGPGKTLGSWSTAVMVALLFARVCMCESSPNCKERVPCVQTCIY